MTKQAETVDLTQQTEFFHHLVDEAASAIYVCDAENYQLLYVNHTCARICGKSVEQARGQTCYAYLKGASRPCSPCYLDSAQRDSFTQREYTSPATGRHYLARDRLIDWGGRPALVEFLLDETEHVERRLQLEASQRGLELASANAGVSFWQFDIDSKRLTWADYCRGDAMGYPTTMEDMPESMLRNGEVHAADADEFRRMYQEMFDDAERSECTVRMLDRNSGRFIWHHLIYTRLHDAQYGSRRAIGFAANVDLQQELSIRYRHELQLRQEMMRESESYFQVNLTRGVIEEYHSKFGNRLQMSFPTPTNQSFRDELLRLVLPEDRPGLADVLFIDGLLRRWQAGESSASYDYRRRLPTGDYCWLRSTATLLQRPDSGEVAAFIHSRNIDREKKDRLALEAILDQEVEASCLVNARSGQAHLLRLHGETELDADAAAELAELDYQRAAQLVCGCVLEADLEQCRALFDLDGLRRELEAQPHLMYNYRALEADGELRRKGTRAFYLDATRSDIVLSRCDVSDIYDAQLRNESLRKSAELLRLVVEHSSRAIYRCQLSTGKAVSMELSASRALGLPDRIDDFRRDLFASGLMLPESATAFERLLQAARQGQAHGSGRFRVHCQDGVTRWLDVKYTLLASDGAPNEIVASCLDVSELHERELAYARYQQRLSAAQRDDIAFFEADISTDLVEQQGGFVLSYGLATSGQSHSQTVEQLVRDHVLPEGQAACRAFFARERLLTLYADGRCEDEQEWQVLMPDGERRWLRGEVQLVADPYSGHIKAFTTLNDVTQDKLTSLAMQQRAETDGMTGVYNKTTTEAMIEQRLRHGDAVCALLIVDLDRFKQLNDQLGHAQGDQAIRLLAQTLRAQFRQHDIVGRVGGDEFAAFVEGVSESRLRDLVEEFLHSLSVQRVGLSHERQLRASVGLAVGRCGRDGYAQLFQQADTALYQVKRNGRNGYAFYGADMEAADFCYNSQAVSQLRPATAAVKKADAGAAAASTAVNDANAAGERK